LRNICPVCGNGAVDDYEMDFEVPDRWPLPKENWWNLCRCGFVWLCNNATEDNYNEYYKKFYVGATYHSDSPHLERLKALAQFISYRFPRNTSIIDYGGGLGQLGIYLRDYGFNNYSVCDVGQQLRTCDLIVASHVIEHIYNLNAMMMQFRTWTDQVLVELPESLGYSYKTFPPLLDYQTQHINHFGISQLDMLFSNYDFSCEYRESLEFHMLNMPTYRAIYKNNGHHNMFDRIKHSIDTSKITLEEKMIPIRQLYGGVPFIIYGLGDYAMWFLATVKNLPSIAGFVDKNPIYKGMTLMGMPILDHVEGDYPILVIARGKQQDIVDDIKSLGIKNRVIVL
jgi:hypothetical protein